jgi:hypothetical protein
MPTDPRNLTQVDRTSAEIIRFRLLAIVASYENGNNCSTLRHDPIFKIALGCLPEQGEDLCPHSTVSQLENLPSRKDLQHIRSFIEAMLESELEATLNRGRYEHRVFTGHRHGHRDRQILGTFGPTTVSVPRARLVEARAGNGGTGRCPPTSG